MSWNHLQVPVNDTGIRYQAVSWDHQEIPAIHTDTRYDPGMAWDQPQIPVSQIPAIDSGIKYQEVLTEQDGTVEDYAASTRTLQGEEEGRYLQGWRKIVAIIGFSITFFLPVAEISIVSTSLVTVSTDLNGFDQSSWVVTSYLCAFTGFIIIWSKLSDRALIGFKPTIIISGIIFLAFSAACGAAQTIDQLIIFRAFQGLGGAGVYSLPSIGFFNLVPPRQYALINAFSSVVIALGLVVSPLIGGAISQTGHWRWIFYYNLPTGIPALLALAIVLPGRFPFHWEPRQEKTQHASALHAVGSFVRKADPVGAFLILGGIIFLVAAMEEGGVRFAWSSGVIIAMFVLSACFLAFLVFWTAKADVLFGIEPAFPKRFAANAILVSALLGCLASGAPMTVAAIELPQRYQIVNGVSPLDAGVKLLSYAVATPVGIVIGSVLSGRLGLPFVFILFAGTIIQTVGFALLGTVPTTTEIWTGIYGYSFLMGLGVGVCVGTYYAVGPVSSSKEDQHLTVGFGLQCRMIGGSLGIAVANSVWNNSVRSHLATDVGLTGDEIDMLLNQIQTMVLYPSNVQIAIREAYAKAYNLQMHYTIIFTAMGFLVAASLWRKKQLRLGKNEKLVAGKTAHWYSGWDPESLLDEYQMNK